MGGDYHLARIEDGSPYISVVTEWMNRPHLAKAWEYPNPESWWREHIEAQNAGTYSVPVMLTVKGEPTAYIELYRPGRDVIGLTYEAHPQDIGVHIGVGNPNATGHGLAGALLLQGVPQGMELNPGFERVIFEPDWRNRSARVAALRAGSFDGGWHKLPTRTVHLLMLCKDGIDEPVIREDLLVEAKPGESRAPDYAFEN
nr:GNAT family N-acetyltransferase [Corynebacterium sp. TAE3-ERU12]